MSVTHRRTKENVVPVMVSYNVDVEMCTIVWGANMEVVGRELAHGEVDMPLPWNRDEESAAVEDWSMTEPGSMDLELHLDPKAAHEWQECDDAEEADGEEVTFWDFLKYNLLAVVTTPMWVMCSYMSLNAETKSLGCLFAAVAFGIAALVQALRLMWCMQDWWWEVVEDDA